ncbi:hypothetical protein [Herbaspirillum huttiense]|uniref:Uncharacterized protein n=2 Tax=Herbaspirillum huttiense TaxID=863372 RepID=A0AAJ2H9R6_9BURK|nr:hypothetical protein [Herbaspirillum huttiense]MDR9839409.1 hypothetical protein [Herbaspirillum huttiense]
MTKDKLNDLVADALAKVSNLGTVGAMKWLANHALAERALQPEEGQANLLPCPFCGQHLSSISEEVGYWRHPDNECLLSRAGFNIGGVNDMSGRWNSRALRPEKGGAQMHADEPETLASAGESAVLAHPEEGQAHANPYHSTFPQRVWLNVGDCNETELAEFSSHHEITWADSQIDQFDIEYVRADLASQLALPAGPGTEDQMKSAIQELFDNAPYNDGVPFVRCSDVMDVIDAVYASPSPAVAQPVLSGEDEELLRQAKELQDAFTEAVVPREGTLLERMQYLGRYVVALKDAEAKAAVAQPVPQQFPTKLHLRGAISVLFNQEQNKFHDEQASIDGMLDSWTSWEQHYNNALADFFWPMVGAVAQPVADEREAFELTVNKVNAPRSSKSSECYESRELTILWEGWKLRAMASDLLSPAAQAIKQPVVDERDAEIARLNAIINTPQSGDFLRAVSTEAEHQRQRWGSSHDAGKAAADWFWLVGYLAGKALHSNNDGDLVKAEHHIITTAAALMNWHMAMFGKTDMRPGIDGDAALGQPAEEGGKS